MRIRIIKVSLFYILTAAAAGQVYATNAGTAPRLLDECIRHLHEKEHLVKPDQSVTLTESCPSLHRLIDNPVFLQLDPALANKTTLGQLVDSKRALASINTPPLNNRRLNRSGLDSILKSIYQQKTPAQLKKGMVDKFMDWLDQKFNEYFKHDNWFTRNFGKNLDEKAKQGLVNTLIVILILIVIFLVANELRAARTMNLFKRRKHPKSEYKYEAESKFRSRINLNDIAELPLYRQVPALLRYTLQHLMEKQILPRRDNLTNREFLAIVREKLPQAGRDFELLVNQIEKVIYGNKSLAVGNTSKLYEHVRNIEQIRETGKS